MKRKITAKLRAWKARSADRKPLLLYGARQVGKTFILLDFAKGHYENYLYLNFEQNLDLKSIFTGNIAPQKIVSLLESYFKVKVFPEKTLIIFDEIQACAQALTSLKYFAENAPEYHVMAAGSLLGVATQREHYSFPVGKVQIETLHPLDFEEFLIANDNLPLADMIKEGVQNCGPLIEIFHNQALELLNSYLLTGGMPAAVAEYIANNNLEQVKQIQDNILTAYLADMAKYTSATDAVKVRTAFESIPAQLAKENKKFQYKLLKKGASSSHFGIAIDWLLSSGIVNKCRKIEHGFVPISAYADLSAFKLYMADVGLLCQKSAISMQQLYANQSLHFPFKGALIENYVAQALCSNGHNIYYWESKSIAEVDFVVNQGDYAIPIEVKSSESVRSRSLSVYIDKYKPPYSIRISTKNFGIHNKLRSVPLYAAFTI